MILKRNQTLKTRMKESMRFLTLATLVIVRLAVALPPTIRLTIFYEQRYRYKKPRSS